VRVLICCLAIALLPALAAAGDAPVRVGISSDPMPVYSGAAEDFTRTCEGCHTPEGAGIPGLVPRLNGFVGLFLHVPGGREFIVQVPGVSLALLGDERLTAVVNWMLSTYGASQLPSDFHPYTVDEVRRLRAGALVQVAPRRAVLIEAMRSRGLLMGNDDGLGPFEIR
jgi:mono/diheme cytochrome c family protein